MEDLTDSAEMLRSGPPQWFHAILLLMMMLVFGSIPFLGIILLRIL